MALNYNIDPTDDWGIFDFSETVTYTPNGTVAIPNNAALRRPISQSQGRRIEQFDIGTGLDQMDIAMHIAASNLAAITLTPYDFSGPTAKDTVTDAAAIVYDVIFAERHVDASKIFVVLRKR